MNKSKSMKKITIDTVKARALIAEQGLSLAEAAHKMGRSPSYLSNYLRHTPTADMPESGVKLMAAELGFTVADVMYREPEPKPEPVKVEIITPRYVNPYREPSSMTDAEQIILLLKQINSNLVKLGKLWS